MATSERGEKNKGEDSLPIGRSTRGVRNKSANLLEPVHLPQKKVFVFVWDLEYLLLL